MLLSLVEGRADSRSIGNAKISGMQDDLSLSSNEYSIALVVFFVGYVVFEVPSKYVLINIEEGLS